MFSRRPPLSTHDLLAAYQFFFSELLCKHLFPKVSEGDEQFEPKPFLESLKLTLLKLLL